MITIKEEFVGCTKWLRAVEIGGSDAIVMWLVLKGYAASNPTDGFIPEDDFGRLPGKPKNWKKALKALEECGRMQPDGTRAAGLLDKVPHGVQLHDYLDHAPSSAEVEERRRKERERKRAQRGTNGGTQSGTGHGTTPPVPPGTEDGTSSGTSSGTPDGTPQNVQVPPRARPRVPTLPNSSQPDPPPQTTPAEEEKESTFVACPRDLALTDAERGTLITSGIKDYAIDAITARFRAHSLSSEPRTLAKWRRSLITAITSDWNDPRRRPKPPEAARTDAHDVSGMNIKLGAEGL